MPTIQESLKNRLVVSCQAWPGDPLDDVETIRRIARSAVLAGAGGLRLNSPEHIAAVRQDTDLPIIGIQKQYIDGKLYITPDFKSAAALAEAGATMIALDCTSRPRPNSESWQGIIERIHTELQLPVMADIATLDEALAAAANGADFVGTTLSGYTEETRDRHSFDWLLLAGLVREVGVPIIAEGHISTPEDARRTIRNGALCVVVGSAITRPGDIAKGFIDAIESRVSCAPVIGVDIGGTSIKAGLVDEHGNVSFPIQVPTEASKGRTAIVAGLTQAIEHVLSVAQENGLKPERLGIASAGAIDDRNGIVFAATDNLPGWAGFRLREFAETHFHLPTRIVNDAHAAVLAELHFGAGRTLSDFVSITIGTGVGGGIVSNGKLLTGQHGFAGTIGHHVIRVGGRPCNCGRNGCLEAYVSTAALLHEYQQQGGVAEVDPTSSEAARALKVSQLAKAGDPAALKAYGILAEYTAEGVANIYNLFDPQVVFISGGLVEGQTGFVEDVERRVVELLHFGLQRQPKLQLSSAGHYVGVQGAGALALQDR